MAGTIFGLPLSQRVDSNGDPLVGWLLYLYVQNSSTPVNSYSDTALTVLNPWPIEADSAGMMPIFWLADGSYRVRGTSNDGSTTLFDLPSVLAIGASTGSAPSGGVDPNAIFATGDVMWQDVQGTRAGWVRDNGRTIGSSTSGASERANADCHPLFLFLWNGFSDTLCPVLGGRGLNAEADWGANKKITLPDKRGYAVGGLDDMGNSAASAWTGVPVVSGTVTTAGAKIGENMHTLTDNEMASTPASGSLSVTIGAGQGSHSHTGVLRAATQGGAGSGNLLGTSGSTDAATLPAMSGTAFGSLTVQGNDDSHNTAQFTVLGTFYRKL